MIRTTIAAAAAISFGLGVFYGGYQFARTRPGSGTAVWSTGPTVTQLEGLSQLVSTRVHVADVLVAESDTYRGSWLIKGDGLLSIDLSLAKIVEISPQKRTARVRLPSPKVLSARVDHERTKTWSVEKTTWVPWKGEPDGMRDHAMQEAAETGDFRLQFEGERGDAKSHAQTVIQNVYRLLEWDVTVEWDESRPSANSNP